MDQTAGTPKDASLSTNLGLTDVTDTDLEEIDFEHSGVPSTSYGDSPALKGNLKRLAPPPASISNVPNASPAPRRKRARKSVSPSVTEKQTLLDLTPVTTAITQGFDRVAEAIREWHGSFTRLQEVLDRGEAMESRIQAALEKMTDFEDRAEAQEDHVQGIPTPNSPTRAISPEPQETVLEHNVQEEITSMESKQPEERAQEEEVISVESREPEESVQEEIVSLEPKDMSRTPTPPTPEDSAMIVEDTDSIPAPSVEALSEA